ncbi:MAG: hypothetical protein JWO06_963, partial [Bacteroidota bacterium]|nr:hypothetical protein [Bacteroidota bacterium]
FVIAYGGTLYQHQRIDIFFAGVRKFLAKSNSPGDVEIVFYGISAHPEMMNAIKKEAKELNNLIKFTSKYSYQEVLKKFRESHVLLLLTSEGADWLNAKVFDYLAVKRPILLVQNDHGVMQNLLATAQGGFSADTDEDVCHFLLGEYARFKKGDLNETPSENIDSFSREKQAEVLFKVLTSELKNIV